MTERQRKSSGKATEKQRKSGKATMWPYRESTEISGNQRKPAETKEIKETQVLRDFPRIFEHVDR